MRSNHFTSRCVTSQWDHLQRHILDACRFKDVATCHSCHFISHLSASLFHVIHTQPSPQVTLSLAGKESDQIFLISSLGLRGPCKPSGGTLSIWSNLRAWTQEDCVCFFWLLFRLPMLNVHVFLNPCNVYLTVQWIISKYYPQYVNGWWFGYLSFVFVCFLMLF